MHRADEYINTIIQGDCIDIMRELPDKCIDLVLTDPPYGIKQNAHRIKSRTKLAKTIDYGDFSWDNKIPEPEYFEEMIRTSKNQIIWGGNYFADILESSSCWLVWDKENGNTNFADCELAWTSFGGAVRIFRYMWNGMLQGDMKNKENRIHPTQKPVKLFTWILQNYSKEGDLILDPFSGSGTTAIACHRMNRRFICIEKEEKYVKLSRERLKVEHMQQRLPL